MKNLSFQHGTRVSADRIERREAPEIDVGLESEPRRVHNVQNIALWLNLLDYYCVYYVIVGSGFQNIDKDKGVRQMRATHACRSGRLGV
jgi:hypothetical protein